MGDEETLTQSSPSTKSKIPLLTHNQAKSLNRLLSNQYDELQSFRSYLRWMCVDQSTWISASFSFIVFLVLGVAVPAFSHFFLACATCDATHHRPYDAVVQLSLSSVAALSFLCLSRFMRKYGLRRFLFLDKLVNESVNVRRNYTHELSRSLWICAGFVIPCFMAECAYKIWWYASGASQIPFLGNVFVSDVVACFLELLSWLYRTTVFFLVCVLFRMMCHLQILRLQDFSSVFQQDCDVASVLSEHLRIRRHLKTISHRFRVFIVWALVLITVSQFESLMQLFTKSSDNVDVFRAGEVALCSMTLVAGLLILLHSATKITHKGQAITSLASKWHVCATIDSFSPNDQVETPVLVQNSNKNSIIGQFVGESDGEDSGQEDDEFDNMSLIPAFTSSSISFQRRQALVKYLEHNSAGITLYGFMMDRGCLHLIFGVEMALFLWLLGKTISIGIS